MSVVNVGGRRIRVLVGVNVKIYSPPVTKRIPWVGAGIGIILGVGFVLSDQLIPETPMMSVSILNG